MVQSWITQLLESVGKKKVESIKIEPALLNSNENNMYEIRRHGDAYKIYEKNTKQYIVKTKFKKKASDILSNLKKGGGFEGTTPRFMIQAGELDIDKKIKKIPGYSN